MTMHSEMRSNGLTLTDIEKIVNFDWETDEKNYEEELEGAVSFEIITEEILQSVVDNGENTLGRFV